MKFEAGKTYKTRGGEEAFIYCVDAPGACPIHGRIRNEMLRWTESGNMIASHKHSYDLIAPEPERISRIAYVNDYGKMGIVVHNTEESARSAACERPKRTAIPCRLEEITE
jgi:hypothetical protein